MNMVIYISYKQIQKQSQQSNNKSQTCLENGRKVMYTCILSPYVRSRQLKMQLTLKLTTKLKEKMERQK